MQNAQPPNQSINAVKKHVSVVPGAWYATNNLDNSVAVSTVCNAYVSVVRAWVVDRDKHFTQYVVRTPVETPNANNVVNYLHIRAKIPTQIGHNKTLCMHSFAGLMRPH